MSSAASVAPLLAGRRAHRKALGRLGPSPAAVPATDAGGLSNSERRKSSENSTGGDETVAAGGSPRSSWSSRSPSSGGSTSASSPSRARAWAIAHNSCTSSSRSSSGASSGVAERATSSRRTSAIAHESIVPAASGPDTSSRADNSLPSARNFNRVSESSRAVESFPASSLAQGSSSFVRESSAGRNC